MRTSKGYLFRACCNKELCHHHCIVAATQPQAEGGEGRFRYASTECHGKVIGKLMRSGCPL